MKRIVIPVAIGFFAGAVAVWLALSIPNESIPDNSLLVVERGAAPSNRLRRESAPEESIGESISAEAESVPSQTQCEDGNILVSTACDSATSSDETESNQVSEIVHSRLEQSGYTELIDTPHSAYKSYDMETLLALANSGDKHALLHAAILPPTPLAQRKQYAIAAAKQGYTIALTALGQSLLLPESAKKSDRITGFALLLVARELNDPVARGQGEYDTWYFMKQHVSGREQEQAEIEARELLKHLGVAI